MFALEQPTIGQLHANRDNNFNLLRFLAALTVLIAHSYPLTGAADSEPLRGRLGMSIGSIAVDVFFVASGFLVTESLNRARNAVSFIAYRGLRIYPGLIVVVLLTAYVMGPAVTTLATRDYWIDPAVHLYAVRTASLVTGVGWVLPGVFESNPFPSYVNGSLWTLPLEVGMYGALLAIWLAARSFGSTTRHSRTFIILVAAAMTVAIAVALTFRLRTAAVLPVANLAYMFAAGAMLYSMRSRVVLAAPILLVMALLAIICIGFRRTDLLYVIYVLTLPYAVIFLALVPRGTIRTFNRVGDYSYGVYIYAMPVQQLIAFASPGIGPRMMLICALVITIALAVVSWHLVERPALRLKEHFR